MFQQVAVSSLNPHRAGAAACSGREGRRENGVFLSVPSCGPSINIDSECWWIKKERGKSFFGVL